MANANTPYIAKAAQPLINPTTATIFPVMTSPIATVAATQVAKSAFVKYSGFDQFGSGVSNNINTLTIAIRASGRVTGGTTTNFTPTIYIAPLNAAVPSLTVGSNTVLGALSAIAFNTASGNWKMSIEITWDLISGQINGLTTGYGGSGGAQTTTASTAITPLTGYVGVQPLSTLPTTVAANNAQINNGGEVALTFAVGGLFSASNANNIAYLDNFAIEEI